jgi:hypothetical protein
MTGRTPGSCCCHLEKAEFEEPVWRDGSGRVHCCAMPTWRPFARCCWRNISVGWTHSRSGRRRCNGEATVQPDDRATSRQPPLANLRQQLPATDRHRGPRRTVRRVPELVPAGHLRTVRPRADVQQGALRTARHADPHHPREDAPRRLRRAGKVELLTGIEPPGADERAVGLANSRVDTPC